jgi:hypothetical protein
LPFGILAINGVWDILDVADDVGLIMEDPVIRNLLCPLFPKLFVFGTVRFVSNRPSDTLPILRMLLLVKGEVVLLTLINTAIIFDVWTLHFREVDILANVFLEVFSVSCFW